MSEYPTIEARFENRIPASLNVKFHYHLFLLHTTMTLTQWTSVFVALALSLPLASAVFDQLKLDFKLKPVIFVEAEGGHFEALYITYYINSRSVLTWAPFPLPDPRVCDLSISALLHINMKDMKLEA
jgi:hypothetical protein